MPTNQFESIARSLQRAWKFESNPPRPEKLLAYANAGLGIRKPRILDAIRINSLPAVQGLVRTRRDADWMSNMSGNATSPLMLATRAQAHDIIEFLLAKGACSTTLHPTLDFQHSPLYMAIQLGDAKTIALMLEHGCDLEKVAYKGDSGFVQSGAENLAARNELLREVIALGEMKSIQPICHQAVSASSRQRL